MFHVIGPLADAPPQQASRLPAVQIGGVAGSDGIVVPGGSVVLEGLYVRKKIESAWAAAGPTLRCALCARCSLKMTPRSWPKTAVACTSAIAGWAGRQPGERVRWRVAERPRAEVSAADFDVENSVFVDNGDYSRDGFGGIRWRAPSAGTRRSTVVNTTFHQQSGLVRLGKYYTTLWCDKPVSDRLVLWNALFTSDRPLITTPEEHYLDPSCGALSFNLASNDAALAKAGVLVSAVEPLYLNAASRDLRLRFGVQPEQKALAAGGTRQVSVGEQVLTAPERDLDGKPRPAEQIAVGAFEPTTIVPR